MSTTTNNAAYLTAKATSLEIKPAPHPTPADDEVVITTRAVAINPVDNFIQEIGTGFPGITLPAIPGFDVAGEVEAVGPAVTRLKAGDRVAGLADVPAGAFQEHVALAEHLTTPLPASVSWAQGAVLPMGVSVAAKALFHRDMLAMDLPTAAAAASSGGPDPGSGPGPRGRAVLIWGGATSVGSCAIQLAVAAGYEVVTTASPRNFEYVTRLGAAQVFDYNSPTVREDLLAAFGGKTVAGALANAVSVPKTASLSYLIVSAGGRRGIESRGDSLVARSLLSTHERDSLENTSASALP